MASNIPNAQLIGLFRKPLGTAGGVRQADPNGQIMGKGEHIGFKMSTVLTLTAMFDTDKDNKLTRSELDVALTQLQNTGLKEDSGLGAALKQLDIEIDATGGISAFEQKRQVSGSILQTLKDYFSAVDTGDTKDDAISTEDLTAINKNDAVSRMYLDGENQAAAGVLSDRYFTNADLFAAQTLTGGDAVVQKATDPTNIPNFSQYKPPAAGGGQPGDFMQILMDVLKQLFGDKGAPA